MRLRRLDVTFCFELLSASSTVSCCSADAAENFFTPGNFSVRRACDAAETIAGQFAVSQAAEIPAALRERKVLRSNGVAGEQSCSSMLKTLCVALHAVNPKIRKRQNGLLNDWSPNLRRAGSWCTI